MRTGRPTTEDVKYVPVTIMVRPVQLDFIDRAAEKLNLSRAQLMRNMIDLAIDDAKIMDSLGLMDMVGWFRRLKSQPKQIELPL